MNRSSRKIFFHCQFMLISFILSLLAVCPSLISAQTSGISPADSLAKPYIPDIGTFMKIGSCSSPTFDRSSGEIFFRSSMTGASQLYKITPEGWPYQLTLFDDGIEWYAPSYDGARAIIGASTGGSEQAQLYMLDTKTGRIDQITDNPAVQFGSVAWDRDGKGYFYRSNAEVKKDFKIYHHRFFSPADNKDIRHGRIEFHIRYFRRRKAS